MHEIHQYDIQKNGELIDTLECYLNHKQSIRKTSELMGVHARTVSYRLQKIVKLTRIDFDNILVLHYQFDSEMYTTKSITMGMKSIYVMEYSFYLIF
mgnify:CR=1 FL=1